LQALQDAWQKVGKLGLLVITNRKPIRIELSSLDVKELLNSTDGRLIVCGLQTLRLGPAFEETSHLPKPAGHGLENSQLAWVVGNGRNGRQDGQCAVSWREILGIVCCLLFFQILHSHKRSFGHAVRAT